MRSVTAYRDHRGSVTLMCTAQVLLEEHTPSALGNPCAMITTPFPEAMAHARSLLDHLDYRGFMNLTPRSTSRRLLPPEVNPASGGTTTTGPAPAANVARFIVADLIEDRAAELVTVTNDRTVVPKKPPTLHHRRDAPTPRQAGDASSTRCATGRRGPSAALTSWPRRPTT